MVGEQVYFTGASHTFEDSSYVQLEHGEQGEVMGPAICESHRGKGVAVSFPGRQGGTIIREFRVSECYLNHVRRRRRRTATRAAPAAPCSSPPPSPSHITYGWRCMGVQVSREPPPEAVQQVYYTGPSETFEVDRDALTPRWLALPHLTPRWLRWPRWTGRRRNGWVALE